MGQEQLQAKERKDEYQKQVASSMEHYRDDIKKLHVFPSGSNNDRYFVVSDNIVGCSDPGIAWAISRKLHSSPLIILQAGLLEGSRSRRGSYRGIRVHACV